MANKNSFTETTTELVKQVNITLDALVKLNASTTTLSDTVTVSAETTNPLTGDPSTYTYTIPSYQKVLNKVESLSNAVDAFLNGSGSVLLEDGTYRQVKATSIAKSPDSISGVSAPTKFYTKPNWFFEDFIYPKTYVQFDLKGKINDTSDRILIKRVIFNNSDDTETQWFKDNVIGTIYTYPDLITLFNNNGKKYFEDEQVVNLPLFNTEYEGSFLLTQTKVVNGTTWYYLDDIKYGINDDDETVNNIELRVNDQLRYGDNSLFKVTAIDISEKKVTLVPMSGLATPKVGNSFDIYSPPFNEKIVDIGVGYNECNALFIKGIDDNYNISSGDWGNSISFYTNDLTYQETPQGYESYYFQNVVDYGKEMEGRIKDGYIPAYSAAIPDAPTLEATQFQVTQVNKQINSALDTEAIKSTQTQIESSKTIINSLKNTIAQQKAELVELTDAAARLDLQSKIDANTSRLSKQTIQYSSLVRSLSTVAYENNAVINSPKYRIRGFFEIPQGKRLSNDSSEIPQEIIQFEVSYRYLRLDGTGNPLNSYSYTDPSTGQKITGTYTDWVSSLSPIKKKQYDASLGRYVWVEEQITDGSQININQVDIPMTSGEKVEVRIKSISEAGWPLNPVKSDWSNTVTIDFPSNLQGTDQIVNILTDAQAEETAIKLSETLSASGMTTHIDDSVPNPNTGDGTYYKHQAKFLAFNYKSNRDEATGIAATETTVDLQTYLENLSINQYVTVTNPSGGNNKTVILQTLLQQILNDSSTGQVMFDNL